MIPATVAIFVATAAIDMRRSFDGLADAARTVLGHDPKAGALFVFFNRSRTRLKLLWWDRSGYCLLYKRLEAGVFRVPDALSDGASNVSIDARELALILEGVVVPDERRQTAREVAREARERVLRRRSSASNQALD